MRSQRARTLKLAESGRYDTAHYNFVASGAAFGVLTTDMTTDTVEQTLNRAGVKAGNRDAESVLTMTETVKLLRKIAESGK